MSSAMECNEIGSLLHAYADGELDARESACVEAHLKFCSSCREQVATVRAWHDAIRNAARTAEPALSPDFAARLEDQLENTTRQLEKMGGHASGAAPHFNRPWLQWFSIAASLTLFVGAGFLGSSFRQADESTSKSNGSDEQTFILYAKDATLRHVHQLPVEVSAGQQPQRVGQWFRGKVDFEPNVPNLKDRASLVGARLSNVRDRQAAYFVYDVPDADDRRASLFAFDAPDLEVPKGRKVDNCDVVVTNQQGYNVVIWKNDAVAYSLVADLDEQDILDMVASTCGRDDDDHGDDGQDDICTDPQ